MRILNVSHHRFLRPLALLFLLLSVSLSILAQSADRDNPTPLSANDIKGSGTGNNEDQWYTFLAGPGDVALTLDVKARSGGTVTNVRLYDFDANEIARVSRSAYTDRTERAVKRLSLPTQQPVLLRIEIDTATGPFLVRVQGALQLSGTDQSFAPAAMDASAPAPITTTTEPLPTTASGENKPPSKLQRFWMRLGTAGEMLGFADLGSLRLQMKDGTTQAIPLLKVAKLALARPDALPEETAADKPLGWKKFWLKLGTGGDLPGLNGDGSLRITMRDGTTQDIALPKIRKASFTK